jgi:hypothetical protein
MDIAPANDNRPWEKDLCPLCPSDCQVRETCSHILFCNHARWVEALMQSVDLLEQWPIEVDTDPNLQEWKEICEDMDCRYRKVVEEQDAIGWRCFVEGMLCRGLREL